MASALLPTTFRKLQAVQLGTDFRKVTQIATVNMPSLVAKHVIVKIHFAGVNASDINYTNGKYVPGIKPPFDIGGEAIGVIAAVAPDVENLRVGQAVAFFEWGAYAEYRLIHTKYLIPIPAPVPEALPVLVSGLTASLALHEAGRMKAGETVLVTAAAGGTGVFAVQLAKIAGCHVIGTCGEDSKIPMLKALGADRVINYKKEDIFQVLKKEYPRGVDLVYESVGGQTFEACVNSLAIKGRLIIIGMLGGYQDGSAWSNNSAAGGPVATPLPGRLLRKSLSLIGFFLQHYLSFQPAHLSSLSKLIKEGKLKVVIDPKPFHGLEQVADAIDHMYSGGNVGKIVVDLRDSRDRSKSPQMTSRL